MEIKRTHHNKCFPCGKQRSSGTFYHMKYRNIENIEKNIKYRKYRKTTNNAIFRVAMLFSHWGDGLNFHFMLLFLNQFIETNEN